jgi:hypothetical protein
MPTKAQTRRRNLRLDEGLRGIAPNARARSCASADARLPRRGSLQPVAHESTVPWHRVDPSGEPKNGPFASPMRRENSKSGPQERSRNHATQFNENKRRHFRRFCIRLLGSRYAFQLRPSLIRPLDMTISLQCGDGYRPPPEPCGLARPRSIRRRAPGFERPASGEVEALDSGRSRLSAIRPRVKVRRLSAAARALRSP